MNEFHDALDNRTDHIQSIRRRGCLQLSLACVVPLSSAEVMAVPLDRDLRCRCFIRKHDYVHPAWPPAYPLACPPVVSRGPPLVLPWWSPLVLPLVIPLVLPLVPPLVLPLVLPLALPLVLLLAL